MKDHTGKLLAKADRAIHAAQILLDSEEAEFAVGRGYYAMFYIAEALLFERGQEFRKHSTVHSAYGKEFAKIGLLDPKFHRWMLEAFNTRIENDYSVDADVSTEDVEEVLEHAKEFLAAARSFLEQDADG